MSVLVLSEHDVRELLDMESCIAAMEDVLARLARGELTNPLRSLMLPPGPAAMGLMPSHAAGDEPVFALKEIVVVGDNPARGLDPHQGVRDPPRRHDRTAARGPQRLADHRDQDGRRVRCGDEAARPPRLAHGRRARLRHPGTVPRRRDADRARRPDHPDLEPEPVARGGARARDSLARGGLGRGSGDGRRHRLHRDVRDRALRRAPLARARARMSTQQVRFRTAAPASSRRISVAAARLYVDRRESTLNESGDFLLAAEELGIGPEHIVGEIGEVLAGTCRGPPLRRRADRVQVDGDRRRGSRRRPALRARGPASAGSASEVEF